MIDKDIDNRLIARKMIQTAVNFDESLAEILKVEVKRIKQLAKESNLLEEVQKTSFLIRNIIMALTITDEKIKTGIEFYKSDNETKHI